jgi:hypothetical protein
LYVEASILVAPEISVVVAYLKANYTFTPFAPEKYVSRCDSEALPQERRIAIRNENSPLAGSQLNKIT